MKAPPTPEHSAGAPRRAIRSYVLRAGRMGSGQARALAELGPRYLLPFAAAPLDANAVFGRRAPLVVEVGFGMGQATAHIAALQPDTDFIGIEVHPPGARREASRATRAGCTAPPTGSPTPSRCWPCWRPSRRSSIPVLATQRGPSTGR